MVKIDDTVPEPGYKASDVYAVCGLSYRQLNDWEERGALPESKDRGAKWRKYSLHDLFVIMVLVELKKQFNTPIEKLKFVKSHLTRQGDSRLNALLFQVAGNGISQWLLTDFDQAFVLDSEFEIQEMFDRAYFHSDKQAAYVLLNVTPIIQKIGKVLVEKDIAFPNTLHNALQERKEREAEVLKHVRNNAIKKVEIMINDGSIKTVRVTQKRSINSIHEELKKEHDFQKITYYTQDGKIVEVDQVITFKKKEKKE